MKRFICFIKIKIELIKLPNVQFRLTSVLDISKPEKRSHKTVSLVKVKNNTHLSTHNLPRLFEKIKKKQN